MNHKYFLEKFITFVFYLSVLIFFIGFNYQDNRMNRWLPQFLPSIPAVKQLVFLDSLTGYILSGDYISPQYLLKTTNGGTNLGYRIPDTNIVKFNNYYYSQFIGKNNGWEYWNTNQGRVHITIGGSDTTFYTSIRTIPNITSDKFILKQNYPNPFNGSTIIEYSIKEQDWVKLKIYDITGKEMATPVNEVQYSGTYGVPLAVEPSSGVYFHKLFFYD